MKRTIELCLTAGVVTALGCATVRLSSGVVPSGGGLYEKTVVLMPSGGRGAEGAFAEALARYQRAPGRSMDFRAGSLSAEVLWDALRKGGFDSVLVVERHAVVHWAPEKFDWPGVLTSSDATPAPLGFASVEADRPGGRRFVNGRARLFDLRTGALVWWAHGTLGVDRDERAQKGLRLSAQAVARRMAQDGVIPQRP